VICSLSSRLQRRVRAL